MAEIESPKPPVRKLTVKNFSVIKDAELEFGKITVLIGPQSSGKSLLCKLAYFISKDILHLAARSASNGVAFDDFKEEAVLAFNGRFTHFSNVAEPSRIEYSFGKNFVRMNSQILFSGGYLNRTYKFEFSDSFQTLYTSYQQAKPDIYSFDQQELLWRELNELFFKETIESFYIPAGRAFFTNTTKGFLALQNEDIDPLIREFAAEINWNPRWKVNLIRRPSGGLDDLSKAIESIIGGVVDVRGNETFFTDDRGISTPFSLLSSGTQELLPMLHVLERWASLQEHRHYYMPIGITKAPPKGKYLVYLEEPEANVFPATQNDLVRLFAYLYNEPSWDFSWVITTHSPYVLSAFNNLIMAGQLAKDHPDFKDEVAGIVPEKYWIEDGTFRAYCIHDGTLKPILSKSGLIDGEYLDSVSDIIGNEFDSLLRLEYDHSSAS